MIFEVVMMRTYIIDGNKFSNIEGFFDEIDLIMTKGISFIPGKHPSIVKTTFLSILAIK